MVVLRCDNIIHAGVQAAIDEDFLFSLFKAGSAQKKTARAMEAVITSAA